MPEQKSDEKSFIIEDAGTGERKLDIGLFTKILIQRCMGKSLDYARMSGMTDRNLKQFERTIKDDFYQIIGDSKQILTEFGYIIDENTK